MLEKILDKFSLVLLPSIILFSALLTVLEFKIIGYLDNTDIISFYLFNFILLLSLSTLLDRYLKNDCHNETPK